MAQHDYDVANATAAAMRADINLALQAVVTNNAGSSAPSPSFPFQWWADTANDALKLRNAANAQWILIGTLSQMGLGITNQGRLFHRLNTALAGANVATAQNILGVGATLVASTIYEFELFFALSKAAGVTSHTLALGFGGSATLNNLAYQVDFRSDTTSFSPAAAAASTSLIQSASPTVLTGAIASANSFVWGTAVGTISVNAAGTLIPQYTLSAAPGGAYTTQIGSYMKLSPVGPAGAISIGSWS